ncbi:MAG: hypothetical protein V2I33_25105 [Kangiellaceae bacterium]|nr:hypothetical protein [Kangiellaceae bacterium]
MGVSTDKFITKLNGYHGTELKANSITLAEASIPPNGRLYIFYGTPAQEAEYRIKVCYANPITEEGAAEFTDGTFYSFVELFDTSVSGEALVRDVKPMLCRRAKDEFNLNLDPALVRLRDRNGERLLKVYNDDAKMKDTSIYEKKEYCL